MTEQKIFYIDDFKIDLSRSVVITGDCETHVEPKVLQVLLLLTKRQNEVVTHKEIMEHVWKGTEVVPNALQRCIAILRKVLKDDAKAPSIIATHPRLGYRLLSEVRWQPLSTPHGTVTSLITESYIANKTDDKRLKAVNKKFFLAVFSLTTIIIIAVTYSFGLNEQVHQYTKIQEVTQTDAYESHALYSPKAKYLVFNRDAGQCKSHLWAKHLASGKESQLTSKSGSYGTVSFTPDGRELVFAAKKNCGKAAHEQINIADRQLCWNIATLDFALALSAPQMPNFRHQCQALGLKTPKALSNHQYAFLQYNDGRYQLMHYDDLSKKLTILYASKKQYIYHFDYDARYKRFVIISRDQHFSNLVVLLNEQGQLLSSEKIQLLQGMNSNQNFSANFEPQGQYLLATSNKRAYRIDFNGQLQAVKTPETNLMSVVQHPKDQQLLAVKGKKDIDIAQVTLEEKSLTQVGIKVRDKLDSRMLPLSGLTRSSAQDRNARYQPNGNLIAFISDRSGQDQLWLWRQSQEQGQAYQLSFVASQNSIENFSWSPDGKHLAWVSDDRLAITDLDGGVQFLDTDNSLYSILSWYAEDQLLVRLNDPAPGGLYRLDINKNTLSSFEINYVESAWVHQKQLFYSNIDSEVFTRALDNNNEIKRLPELNGKALFIHDESIYSVNQDNFILNQYNLQGQLIKPIIMLKPFAWKVTGLKGNKLLLSQFIAINHDIVILE